MNKIPALDVNDALYLDVARDHHNLYVNKTPPLDVNQALNLDVIKVSYPDVARDPCNLYVNKTLALDMNMNAPGHPLTHLDVNISVSPNSQTVHKRNKE